MSERIEVLKTYKLFIGGKLPRSESGRTLAVRGETGQILAHVSQASRKDLRDAVTAARAAGQGWRAATAYLRGQIVYRMAEMMEGKREELARALIEVRPGRTKIDASSEVDAAIDRVVSLAGWADKFAQVMGCANPVAGPYHNFTVPEPVGVVGVIVEHEQPLVALVTLIAAAMCTGNAVVAIADEANPIAACILGEVCATSDVPGGVVNILTGLHSELLPQMAEHGGLDAVVGLGIGTEGRARLRAGIAGNLKRVHFVDVASVAHEDSAGPVVLEPFVEFKTMWHPAGS
ncbi:MAG: aldehyde dehydrogenase family protein [Phycisphaeraceae bacterium]|nr:aldehyde dehydrogenase family protein [Phycisphaeraceae bacterium]MCW5763340.1 aldehyde dehydrogenase family protein [Phycisphaeraceae bacterium]